MSTSEGRLASHRASLGPLTFGAVASVLLVLLTNPVVEAQVLRPAVSLGPPYSGFSVGQNIAQTYGPAGCAKSEIPVAPFFNQTSGIGGISATEAINTSCSAWPAGSQLGPNSSYANTVVSLSVNRSLNVSSVLGGNATVGYIKAKENWTISYRATENFFHQKGGPGPWCYQPYRTLWFYGCQGHSEYGLSVFLTVWDNTTRSQVPSLVASNGWAVEAQKTLCTTWGSYCSEHGGNHSVNQTVSLGLQFYGKLNASHQYFLATTLTASLIVYLAGWKGDGTARVNVATNGHRAVLTAVGIS